MILSLRERGVPSPEIAPCRLACPIGQDVQEYVACIAEGRLEDAVAAIRRTNPFPSVCGRLCPRPCEFECARRNLDGAVAIRELKRFAADLELKAIESSAQPAPESRKEKIVVIGAGPAGLTAALFLRNLGYPVTVLEALPLAGGMLRLACPEEILPAAILKKEIDAVRDSGVTIVTGSEAGRDFTIDDLFAQGARAVLIATGAGNVKIREELRSAETLSGFLKPGPWLRKRNAEAASLEGRRVLIEGVTGSSLQWAMLAASDGAKEVTVVSELPESRFPVDRELIDLARARGVRLMPLHRVKRLVGKKGRLSRAVLREMIAGPTGNRERVSLESSPGKPRELPVDFFIPSGPRVFDPSPFAREPWLEVSSWGHLIADPGTMMIEGRGLFAGGEALTGGRSVIEAIASGQKAAAGIHGFLSRGTAPRAAAGDRSSAFRFQDLSDIEAQPAQSVSRAPSPGKKSVRIETKMQAIAEARRCLRCGACSECDTCHHFCRWLLHTAAARDAADAGSVVRIDEALLKKSKADAGTAAGAGILSMAARVDASLCDGCARCELACPYSVINTVPRSGQGEPPIALIDPAACRACGLCAAVCPPGAIVFSGFRSEDLIPLIRKIAPSSLVLRCRWSGGDGGPHEIGVGCAAQVPASLVLKALELGCSGVRIVGCGDSCHHRIGYHQARARARDIVEALSLLGIVTFEEGLATPLYGEVNSPTPFPAADAAGRPPPASIYLGIHPARVEIIEASGEKSSARRPVGKLHGAPPAGPGREVRAVIHPSPAAEIESLALLSARSSGRGPAETPRSETVYFPGCLGIAEKFAGTGGSPGASKITDAALDLIRRGCGIRDLGLLAGCCGMPFLASGEKDRFEETRGSVLRRLADAGTRTVIASCSDCLRCLRTEVGARGSSGIRFIHVLELLKEKGVRPGTKAGGEPVTLALLPSHGDGEEDRVAVELLEGLPAVELVSISPGGSPASCCGESGWRTSGRAARRVQIQTLSDMASMGARVLLTTSNHCWFHLRRSLGEGLWQLHDVEVMPVHVFLKERW